jgi:predicted nucleic acid-binding protein
MGTKGRRNEQTLVKLIGRPDVVSLFADENTTQVYADIYAQLRRKGTPIPTNDMWTAALVLQHDLTLYARDAHFDHLPKLKPI